MASLLVKQREMADMLAVSVRWLRGSACPVVLLPSSTEGGRAMVRYDVEQVRAWYLANADGRRVA